MDIIEMFPTPVFIKQNKRLNNTQLVEELYKIQNQAIRDSKSQIEKSNLGGYHTTDILNNPVFATLKNYIVDVMNNELLSGKWYKQDKISEANFIEMWSIINKKGHANTAHNHPLSWFSGVYYPKVPNDIEHAGNICFIDPISARQYTNDYYKNVQSSSCCIPPAEGRLIIFPSWFMHSVKPNLTDEDRIAISFNISKPV